MLFLSEGRRTEPSPPLNLPNAQAGGETGLTLIVFKRDKKQDLKCAVRVLGDGEGKKEESEFKKISYRDPTVTVTNMPDIRHHPCREIGKTKFFELALIM